MRRAEDQHRRPGERVAASPKVNIREELEPEFPALSPDQQQASSYAFRLSQDSASAKSIIHNIEGAYSHSRELLQTIAKDTADVRIAVDGLKKVTEELVEGIPAEVKERLRNFVESVRSQFVTQQEENVRMEKSVAALQREEMSISSQVTDQERRVSSLEGGLCVPQLTIDEPVVLKRTVD